MSVIQRLSFLDNLQARGEDVFVARELQQELGLSPSAASNLLRRWADAGLVDRVAKGTYVTRPIGRLGTRASSEDPALAVGAVFRGKPHRIAYRSALEHHDLLDHPARVIQVATPRRGSIRSLSGRRLQQIHESPKTVALGTESAGHGALVSTPERSLLDAAGRLDLVGGPSVLAQALASARPDPGVLMSLAIEVDAEVPLRRIGSLARQMGLHELAGTLTPTEKSFRAIPLDPQDAGRVAFRDDKWRVLWPDEPHALIE